MRALNPGEDGGGSPAGAPCRRTPCFGAAGRLSAVRTSDADASDGRAAETPPSARAARQKYGAPGTDGGPCVASICHRARSGDRLDVEERGGARREAERCRCGCEWATKTRTHGSFLIRRRRGHPGVVLPLVISNSANHQEGMRLELSRLETSPIRNEPKWKRAMCSR